mgnify:CR=1 FL=1
MTTAANENMAIAPGVVETIVALAVKEVPGVDMVGNPPAQLIQSVFSRTNAGQGVSIRTKEDDTLSVWVHIVAKSGISLPELADNIRQAVYDAVLTQVGCVVSNVDVFVENLRIAE